MKCFFVCFIFLILATSCYCRVPPRNHETEETPSTDNAKENPILTPIERSPIDSSINNENPIDKQTNRKPIGVILFRTQPAFSFRERSPFSPAFPLSPHHHHFSNFGSDANEDPALRLISILFGNRHPRPILPTESTADTEVANTSNESSSAEATDLERRHPFESLFPSIFVPRLDEFDKEMGSETDDKTPDNFENKEKKVITISGKKFVKTTKVKKVKNDFGQFHSVISSLQPFDEKLHDENGNDKIKPDDKETSSTVEKKQVESSTLSNEKIDSSTVKPVQFDSSTAASVDKEEVTELKETSSPKPNDKLLAENLSKDVSKNEIPDKKETDIKVDQMN